MSSPPLTSAVRLPRDPRSAGWPPPNRPLASLQAPAPGLDALALGLWGAALGLVGLACLLVPQRLAQRPANRGVLTIHVNRAAELRVWNQPIATGSLQTLLQRAEQRSPGVRIRLVPDPDVPWGMVQTLVERLEAPKRNLELQLP